MMLNKNLQEINIQNMDTELVAQMFKNYQSNVLFHLEGKCLTVPHSTTAADHNSYQRPQRPGVEAGLVEHSKFRTSPRAEQADRYHVTISNLRKYTKPVLSME